MTDTEFNTHCAKIIVDYVFAGSTDAMRQALDALDAKGKSKKKVRT
jgi:hypothetical protein